MDDVDNLGADDLRKARCLVGQPIALCGFWALILSCPIYDFYRAHLGPDGGIARVRITSRWLVGSTIADLVPNEHTRPLSVFLVRATLSGSCSVTKCMPWR